MRLILIMILAAIGMSAAAQSYTGDYLNARKRLTVRGSNIDTIKNDTTGLLGRTKSLMTADAIYKFVLGRVGSGGGMTNPMTTEGDLIIGGASGTPSRLAIGANNYVLKSNGTTMSWQPESIGVSTGQLTDSLNNVWRQTGNIATNTVNYFGTKNNRSVDFIVNNSRIAQMDSTGLFKIGNTSEVNAGRFRLQGDGLLGYVGSIVLGNGYISPSPNTNMIMYANGTGIIRIGAESPGWTGLVGKVSIAEAGWPGHTPTSGFDVRASTVFNEDGADYDFRVEGDTDPNLIFADASADEVRIGTSTDAGAYKLQVNGNSYLNGNIVNNRALTTVADQISIGSGGLVMGVTNITSARIKADTWDGLHFDVNGVADAMVINDTSTTIKGNIVHLADIFNNVDVGQYYLQAYDFNSITSQPTYSFYSDLNTGMFWGGADAIGFTTNGTPKMYIRDGELSINENSYDFDVRIESDGNANMFFVDAGNNRIGIGTGTPDSTLHVVGGFKLVNGTQGAGKVLTSDANGGASWQTPTGNTDEGSYTPTITNGTNVAASTAYTTNWFRVGDRIHVFGEIQIDATSAGTTTELTFTLPVGSTLSNSYSLAGTAVHEDGTPVRIFADTVNGRAQMKFTPNTATANTYSFQFSYLYTAP